MSRSSSDSNSDSDSDDSSDGQIDVVDSKPAEATVITIENEVNKDEDKSDLEEGQVTTSSGESDDNVKNTSDDDSSGESEFDDGFDDNLMGDENDCSRLRALSEKERETEIFKRIERRDVMRTRWEIEKKLKQAKRIERAKDKPADDGGEKRRRDERKQMKLDKSVKAAPALIIEPTFVRTMMGVVGHVPMMPKPLLVERRDDERMLVNYGSDEAPEYFDPKERSKERKKNVEMNRTDDKRSNAMALLKARREGKLKRGKKINKIKFFLFFFYLNL